MEDNVIYIYIYKEGQVGSVKIYTTVELNFNF